MQSEFGDRLKISIFGQSHGKAIGVLISGLPAGEQIDTDALRAFMARRRPGGTLATARREGDEPIFLSGIENGKTCGSPICAVIENHDTRSTDYAPLQYKPRPGHADYTAYIKYGGMADMRGGGHFSGRLTAPLCIAGGIAMQLLARRGIYVGAHLLEAGGAVDVPFPLTPDRALFSALAAGAFPMISAEAAEAAKAAIGAAAAAGDSVGGIVECAAAGVPAGLGDPLFGGIESRISAALFGIPAVKGIEFGAGFGAARMRGSENNDPFALDHGKIVTTTNNCGGILGGIADGMPILVRAAFKPTPSIGREQQTVDLKEMNETKITVRGRHDPCVAVRAVPAVEAAVAAVILDMILQEGI